MQERNIQTAFRLYESPTELEDADARLLAHARKALENSYSPYSQFKVGAAILLANGEIMGGANYENAAYPLCICAEQSVLSAAASRFPGVAIEAIAVAVHSEHQVVSQPAAPCGACRQVICETEHKFGRPMRVLLQGETGPVVRFEKGGDLLPLAFDASYL